MLLLTLQYFCASAIAQEWMGLEENSAQTVLGLYIANDEADNRSQSLSLFTSLGQHFNADLSLTNNTLSNEANSLNSVSRFIQLTWLAFDEFDVKAAYQFEGETQELEVFQYQFQIDYNPYPWTASLRYSKGEVDIFNQTSILNSNRIPTSFHSDFTSLRVKLHWWFDYFTASFEQTLYDYEKDISLLSSNHVLQRIVKPNAFLHSSILMDKEQKLSLQVPFESRHIAAHYITITSAVDYQTVHIASLDWSEVLTPSTQLVTSISQTLDDDGIGSLNLGLEWTF